MCIHLLCTVIQPCGHCPPHCDKSLGVFRAIAWSGAGNRSYSLKFSEVQILAKAGYLTEPRTITSYSLEWSQVYYNNILFNIVIISKYYYYINIIWSCDVKKNCTQWELNLYALSKLQAGAITTTLKNCIWFAVFDKNGSLLHYKKLGQFPGGTWDNA